MLVPSKAATLTLAWLAAFSPPEKVSAAEWCEANIVLPAASNARPGPLRFTTPQRGMIAGIEEQGAEIIVLMLASQTGKSTVIDSTLSHWMKQAPGPTLLVHPTTQKAEGYVTDRLDPLIRATPALRSIVGSAEAGGRKGGGDSKSHKLFPGGSLNIASSYKPDDLAQRSIKYLLCDEIDRFADSAGTEGDPVSLAIKRTQTFDGKGRKIILASTPTIKSKSKIARWYAQSDQRKFFVTWPCCGVHAPLSFSQMKWEEGASHTACLVCDECGERHDENARRKMVSQGEWVATNENATPGVIGFQAPELVSDFSTLASIAAQADLAKTPEQKRTFQNTVLAEVSEDGAEIELQPSELQRKAEPITSPYPAAFEYVTCGVDIQGNRAELTYVAHAAAGVSAVLDHVVLAGDTSAPVLVDSKLSPHSIWFKLDAALAVTFQRQDRALLDIAGTLIDAGYNMQNVAEFVNLQRRKQRLVFAGKGVSGFDKPWVKEGAVLRGLTKLVLIGVDTIKSHIQNRLNMQEHAPGFIHLPDHLEADYFEGLASEKLMKRYVRGFAKSEYVKEAKRNESFDCLVYATAATRLVPLSRRTARAQAQQQTSQPQQSMVDVLKSINANLSGATS